MSDPISRLFQSPKFKRNSLLLILWSGIALILYSAVPVLTPFILAVTIAYVLDPLIDRMSAFAIQSFRIPRAFAIVIIYLAFTALTVLATLFFVPKLLDNARSMALQVQNLVAEIDDDKMDEWAQDITSWSQRLSIPLDAVGPSAEVNHGNGHEWLHFETRDLSISGAPESPSTHIVIDLDNLRHTAVKSMNEQLTEFFGNALSNIRSVLQGLLSFFFSFFLVFMLAAFIAINPKPLLDLIFHLIPFEDRNLYNDFIKRANLGLTGVIRGQGLICLINGVLTFIGLQIFGIQYALLLGTVAGIFSLIPVFGTILSTIPIFFIALSQSITSAIVALAWIAIIHFIEGNILNPKIMGDSAELHPALIVFALMVGRAYFGIIGALLAVPVASLVVTLYRVLFERIDHYQRNMSGLSLRNRQGSRSLTRNRIFRHLSNGPS